VAIVDVLFILSFKSKLPNTVLICVLTVCIGKTSFYMVMTVRDLIGAFLS